MKWIITKKIRHCPECFCFYDVRKHHQCDKSYLLANIIGAKDFKIMGFTVDDLLNLKEILLVHDISNINELEKRLSLPPFDVRKE